MKNKLLFLIPMLFVNIFSFAEEDICDNYCFEQEQEEVSQEQMDVDYSIPRHRIPRLRIRYYSYEDDPTDELDQDTAWPSRRVDFSDTLFR